MKIIRRSIYSSDLNIMDLPISYEHIRRWQRGSTMSFCFPDLSSQEKTFLQYGTLEEEEVEIAMIEKTFEEHPIN
jgi:hypothetical protein